MKTAGIIAEYNPFHNGHKYQIEETRRQTGADYVVVVMSGDFVQRGDPSMISKYDRAQMAIASGADVVIQLPVCASLSSAEGFATGGVRILEALSVVDVISFGCEAVSTKARMALRTIAQILAEEPEHYRSSLEQILKTGMSYPEAREHALLTYMEDADLIRRGDDEGTYGQQPDQQELHKLISSPNNILAIEYLKALYQSDNRLDVCMIPRQGSGYHDIELDQRFASATAIRHALLQSEECLNWQQYCPPEAADLLMHAQKTNGLITADDFSDALYYGLLQRQYMEGDWNALDHRMMKLLENYNTWSSFAAEMKSRNQTFTAINRYLADILVGTSAEEKKLAKAHDYAPYIRILGYRKTAGALVKTMTEQATLPVLTRPAQAKEQLSPDAYRLFMRDMTASDLHRHMRYRKTGVAQRSDYRMPLVLV